MLTGSKLGLFLQSLCDEMSCILVMFPNIVSQFYCFVKSKSGNPSRFLKILKDTLKCSFKTLHDSVSTELSKYFSVTFRTNNIIIRYASPFVPHMWAFIWMSLTPHPSLSVLSTCIQIITLYRPLDCLK